MIRTTGLARSFGSGERTVRALRSCDLTVERGEIVALAAQRVGAVIQTGGLLPDFTVAMTLRTIAAFPAPRDIDEVLDLADLTALRGRRVG